ncbi:MULTISPECIES: amidase [Bosea]|uniref:amidase n=1 Tax=Bosea TaxID=85413 RepID=UPI00214F69C6|nr:MULTISPECIES: amidase [Bosea]MCR4523892.1 amidase [Bosea sp. 47.2.35]MDR6830289.1 amidase [Bosea robiniae]MDR6897044.1 amidase [Bosea sp. BE109]MDR7140441.1 amidase [Bosea sp. BE168]MDR7177238.1 amidase [Bosea sp. BE271]
MADGIDLTASATALRQALLARCFSATDLLEATFARIDALNPRLNAIVAEDRDAARAMAKASDERIANGTARPLEGLPITIKDAFDVAGLPSSGGLPAYRERVPTEDAAPVARLRAAGAVIIGKTNVPVFSGDFQSYNPAHGVTNNPWDETRSPGGSSGGAAVAVATGMSAFELGSDLGSSIRWPAHACGVFGLKTSWGLISTWGAIPPPPERRTLRNVDLMVAGPITRATDDLDLILRVIAGPRDTALPAPILPEPRRTDAKGLRVALWADDPFAPVDQEVSGAVREAARRLAEAGAIVDETARPSIRFADAFEVYALLNHAVVAYGLPPKVRARIQALASRFSPNDLSHQALQARGARMTPGFYQQIDQRRRAQKRQWASFFTHYDVVLCPPAPVAAIPHDHGPDIHARRLIVNGEPRPYLDFLLWAALATGADLPALSAPVMRSREGLPLGVQIIAPFGEDRTAVAVGAMLEELGGRFTLPPVVG